METGMTAEKMNEMTVTSGAERRLRGRGERIRSAENLTNWLTERQEEIGRVCGGRVAPSKVIRACSVIASHPQNRVLLDCTLTSFYDALLESLAFGLLPLMGRGYFVPDGDRVHFILGYQGMIELAANAGVFVKAFNVFKGDKFEWVAGADEWIEHRPAIDAVRDEAHYICSYCVSKFGDHVTFDVMFKPEIDEICGKGRALSAAWKTDYLEMARKTIVRRAAKFWPLKLDAAAICELDERNNAMIERLI